jgi:thiol-disulfide isomerase/thioredoxin
MLRNTRWRWTALALSCLTCTSALADESRTWTDKSGKFSMTAELIAVQQGQVVLRRSDGQQLTVPVKSLSRADQDFLEGLTSPKSDGKSDSPTKAIAAIAEQFFTELKSEKREVAGESLTKKAQELIKGGKSPLDDLPAPEEGKRAVRVGRAKIDDKTAEVQCQVKSAGQNHKLKLHLRQEDDAWKIFAMSAMSPAGEKSINFEVEATAEGEVDPLQALVGQPFQFTGMTIEGQPLDLSRYQGKVVLVDFWATWCGACRAEMPNVFENYKKHYNDGIEVVAVSVDTDLEALAQYIKKEQPPWAVVADNLNAMSGSGQSMAARYGVRSLPGMVLIGRDGKVAAVNCRGKQLGEQLAQIFGGAATGADGQPRQTQQPQPNQPAGRKVGNVAPQ